MPKKQNDAELLKELYQQLKPVFDSSGQSIYIYLDDANKVCNKRFSSLLKYATPEEWAKVKESFPVAFVDSGSRHDLIHAYQNAMENMEGSTVDITWKTKSGEKVNTVVMLVPISYQGQLFALHFISEK